jgi:L-seryl-tRNA(Ser) seleniumtransferase
LGFSLPWSKLKQFTHHHRREGVFMREDIKGLLRDLPSMDELLQKSWTLEFQDQLGRDAVKSTFADVIGEVRRDLVDGKISSMDHEQLDSEVLRRLKKYSKRSLCHVVNATGVVVHTNLGRSCLGRDVAERVVETASNYSNLEYNLVEGGRGHRNDHVEWLLTRVTGADAALVVNNNAGAVLLCLAALGRGSEVIVSRGELVEIGGSFRIPDIMGFSGAVMKEVGTTNRTHLSDYENAVTPQTGMILKVHPSNFRISGFHSEVSRVELARLSREKNLVFMEDLGSGVIADLSGYGLDGEPTVKQCLESGVDIVTFSGDKLLGGPQIGAVVGRKQILEKLRQYPLLRALRVDKMTLAAFEETLRLYMQGKLEDIPTIRMLAMPPDVLLKRARALARRINRTSGSGARVVRISDAVGGGAFPEKDLPGYGVEIDLPLQISDGTALKRLREGPVPIVAAARDGKVIFHVRTLMEGDEGILCAAVRGRFGGE